MKVFSLSFLSITFCLMTSPVIGQGSYNDDNPAIGTIDGTRISDAEIRSKLINLSSTDLLNNYFEQITDTLKRDQKKEDKLSNESFSEFCLRNIPKTFTACSLPIYDGPNLRKAIAIDIDYYHSKVEARYQRTMFIWLIGHELNHLQRGDFSADIMDNDELRHVSMELLCDEAAGYLVGRLSNDISVDELITIVKKILPDLEQSVFTPQLKYRLAATEAGFFRGKSINIANGQKWNFESTVIEKVSDTLTSSFSVTATKKGDSIGIIDKKTPTGSLYWGEINTKKELNGVIINLVGDSMQKEYDAVYMGEYKKGLKNGEFTAIWPEEKYVGQYQSDKKNGYGTDTWYLGEKQGQRYHGNFSDDSRNGFGVFSFRGGENDTIYVGQWKDGLKNGQGVLFTGNTVILYGIWKDDAYINEGE